MHLLNRNFLKINNLINPITNNKSFPHLLKFNIKNYFSYPCPRKLNELVKLSLFEKEQPSKIKEIWKKYFQDKETSIGLNISGGEMNLSLKK
jgi:hypothetical protein